MIILNIYHHHRHRHTVITITIIIIIIIPTYLDLIVALSFRSRRSADVKSPISSADKEERGKNIYQTVSHQQSQSITHNQSTAPI